LGSLTTYTYDAANRLRTETTSRGTRTYDYDLAGNLSEVVDRNERRRVYDYDRGNRVVSERWFDAEGSEVGVVRYTYDLEGRMRTIVDGATTIERTYVSDATNRLVSERQSSVGGPSLVIEYTSNAIGQWLTAALSLAGSSSPLVRNTYAYDAGNHRLESITQDGSFAQTKRVTFGWQPDVFALASITRTFGSNQQLVATTTYTIDNRTLITDLQHRGANGQVIGGYSLTYNAGALLIENVSSLGTSTYTYDNRNQLTGVTHSDPLMPDESYQYDASGNRIASHRQPMYVVGVDNEVDEAGSSVFTHDAEGNVVVRVDDDARLVHEYSWDHRNRLVRVVEKDFSGVVLSTITYVYDGLNRRVAQTITTNIPDETTERRTFAYDGLHVWMEFVD